MVTQIAQNVQALKSAADSLTTISQSMGSTAEETATQATVVSSAAEQVSHHVQSSAVGMEEISVSIKEVAHNANSAAQVASDGVEMARAADSVVARLDESGREIGDVVKVITSVTDQVNLLSLNATIEAARAGKAGSGFAVVAREVKELAKETAKATEEIRIKIEAGQRRAQEAKKVIAEISGIIDRINATQIAIAGAVEQQAATTKEISLNTAEAAKGSSQIVENILGVAQAARSTTEGSSHTQKAAHQLADMAAKLHELIQQFKLERNGENPRP